MVKKLLTPILILVLLVQLSLPLYGIFKYESAERWGKEYKFKTADYSHFREYDTNSEENYIYVYLPESKIQNLTESFSKGEYMYITLENDSAGFAFLKDGLKHPPKHNNNYLKVKTGYNYQNYIDLPFKYKYNLKKALSSETKKIISDAIQNGDAFITVKVKSGTSVLNKLYIKNKPIEEFILLKKK